MVRFPSGFRCESLTKRHARAPFSSGHASVDGWLTKLALQSQEKRLSTTTVLLRDLDHIAGFFTLATSQVDFSDLPAEVSKKLPRRALPVAVLAWLGVDHRCQNQGLGTRLLAQALADCHAAGRTFSFVAVVIDCIDDAAKAFYQRWDFSEIPGRPLRLSLPAQALDALAAGTGSKARFI